MQTVRSVRNPTGMSSTTGLAPDGVVDAHAAARSNVFVLGQLLKDEVERHAHKATSRPGARATPVTKPGVSDAGASGVPVRQFLSSMYEVVRQKRLGEVCVFVAFALIFGIIAFQLYDVGGEIALQLAPSRPVDAASWEFANRADPQARCGPSPRSCLQNECGDRGPFPRRGISGRERPAAAARSQSVTTPSRLHEYPRLPPPPCHAAPPRSQPRSAG